MKKIMNYVFDLDKLSYLNIVFNSNIDYDPEGLIQKMRNKLAEYIPDKENVLQLYDFESLVKDSVISTIARLPCVKIVIEK